MLLVGADIGGTFTDIVMMGDDGGLSVEKRLSTPEDYSEAIVGGLDDLLRRRDAGPEQVAALSHGTTVATNAILERRGARAALLTTAGFRDVLEIGRLRTPRLYDIGWNKPRPLVPRRLRLEVTERIGADGRPLTPLDVTALEDIAARLERAGVEAVAICFVNAYLNGDHERQAKDVLSRLLPHVELSLSSEVLPEIKEFERTSTTAADAYVKPGVRRYLGRLGDRLSRAGVRCPVYIMQSNGGIQTLQQTAMLPCYAIESGPAAGVVAAQSLAAQVGLGDAITFDMGGTTAKVSMIEEGRLSFSSEFEVGGEVSRNSRLIKGSGYLLRTPVIDIAEVGAGGGSIAWIDAGGGLKVGPEGAGSVPGPACYGRGGARPTVTDANVVLGYINPGAIAGGSVTIDAEAAAQAVDTGVGRPLGLATRTAAYGIHEIANANMARAVRSVTTERGRDVRGYTLIAFGGGGPIHACALAREFAIPKVLVPPHPGLFSAFGLLFADIARHFVYTVPGSRVPLDTGALAHFEELRQRAEVDGARFGDGADTAERFADLRYRGQGHELRVPVQAADEPPEAVARRFAAEHRLQFGHDKPDAPIEVVNLRLIVRRANPWQGRGTEFRLAEGTGAERPAEAGTRPCWFDRDGAPVETRILGSRAALGTGPTAGPLIVEEYDTTIVVPPDFTARCDAAGIVWLERKA